MAPPLSSGQVRAALRRNRRTRERLQTGLEQKRDELSELLKAGLAAGLAVTELAQLAGISRVYAHRLLAQGDEPRARPPQKG